MDKAAKRRKALYAVVFIVYLALLIHFLFFSDLLGRSTVYEDYRYNLKPFREIDRFWTCIREGDFSLFLINVAGNIMMFVPFGFLFTVIMEKRQVRPGFSFIDTFLATLLLCMLVETCQLLTKVGVFDVDDIILNVFGSVLGYVIYLIVRAVRNKKRGKHR